MEWNWWYNGVWPILSPLVYAFIIWLSREAISKRPRLWYVWLAIALTFVILGVQGDLISTQQFPNTPLIYRVLRYLSFALLVVITLVVRPRKQT